jgi:hypothetical protein
MDAQWPIYLSLRDLYAAGFSGRFAGWASPNLTFPKNFSRRVARQQTQRTSRRCDFNPPRL